MPRTRTPKPTDVFGTILDQFAGPARPMSQGGEASRSISRRPWSSGCRRRADAPRYPPGGAKPPDTSNQRKGTSGKTVLTDDGPLTLDIPRDRDGTFEPQLIGKHERRFAGFDDKIVADVFRRVLRCASVTVISLARPAGGGAAADLRFHRAVDGRWHWNRDGRGERRDQPRVDAATVGHRARCAGVHPVRGVRRAVRSRVGSTPG